ncbi:hypothetical protein BD289DRAFT_178527 [Coniella lustricola]|uniref:C2H2-type domain-containing protein n=1 Tax=Coniella lustricola TaxID=2025994 RepID=A0A2T3ADK7_9PEZI|nr:hypothetical protein BD289DRAFT_178527 [Coniella lustricola]
MAFSLFFWLFLFHEKPETDVIVRPLHFDDPLPFLPPSLQSLRLFFSTCGLAANCYCDIARCEFSISLTHRNPRHSHYQSEKREKKRDQAKRRGRHDCSIHGAPFEIYSTPLVLPASQRCTRTRPVNLREKRAIDRSRRKAKPALSGNFRHRNKKQKPSNQASHNGLRRQRRARPE